MKTMTRVSLALALLPLLAACGADGAPKPPPVEKPAISISGTARIGVVKTL